MKTPAFVLAAIVVIAVVTGIWQRSGTHTKDTSTAGKSNAIMVDEPPPTRNTPMP